MTKQNLTVENVEQTVWFNQLDTYQKMEILALNY